MKYDLNAGSLRFRCTFLEREVRVEHGITKEGWKQRFSCWCNAQPLTGREFWEAAAINRENELRFTIRYRKGIDPKMRIRFEDQLYDITEVKDVENRHIKLELLGKTVTEDG